MRQLRSLAFLAVIVVGLGPAYAGTEGIQWVPEDKHVTIVFNWCELSGETDCRPTEEGQTERPRIDSSTQVAALVTSFNFLHYNLDFQTNEREIEAYAYLAGIWDQILGFDLSDVADKAGISGEAATWWKEVRKQRELLKKRLGNYSDSVGLSKTQLDDLKKDKDTFLGKVKELDEMRAEAFDKADSVLKLQQFDIVDRDHQALVEAINSFSSLAGKSLQGSRHNVGKKKAGTVVTVVVAPKALPATTVKDHKVLKSRSAEYLVESTSPLLFHVGITHSELEDAEFKTVRALEGRDLFAKVRDEKGTESFSAYLSYALGKREVDTADWFVTLGTDLEDVGENLYVGFSRRFGKRWLASVGGAYGLVVKGEGEMTEMTETGEETSRQLFEIVREDREWAFFGAISVKVY